MLSTFPTGIELKQAAPFDHTGRLISASTHPAVLPPPLGAQVLPPLGAVIGNGKPFNFMVTNKWRNVAEIERLTNMPLLLMACVRVRLGLC